MVNISLKVCRSYEHLEINTLTDSLEAAQLEVLDDDSDYRKEKLSPGSVELPEVRAEEEN